MSYKAKIFTRKELKQGLHEYLYSVNRPININAMGDYIYDHWTARKPRWRNEETVC